MRSTSASAWRSRPCPHRTDRLAVSRRRRQRRCGGLPCRCRGRARRSRARARRRSPRRRAARRAGACARRSEVSCSSFCFSSGANSNRPASSNESCSAESRGSSTSAPVSSTSRWKSSSACSESSGSATSFSSSIGSTRPVWNERPVRQLEQAEPLPALDDDVEPAVVEAVEHLGDGGERADLAQAVVVGVDQPELALLVEALADQLLVAVLEDVQRDLLGREQHDPEREEAELAHRRSLDALERGEPEKRAVPLETRGRGRATRRRRSSAACGMDEDPEAAPAQPQVEVHDAEARPGPPDLAREAEHERPPRQRRCDSGRARSRRACSRRPCS